MYYRSKHSYLTYGNIIIIAKVFALQKSKQKLIYYDNDFMFNVALASNLTWTFSAVTKQEFWRDYKEEMER